MQEIRASVVRSPIVVDDEGGRRGSQAGNGRLLEGEAACGRTGGVRVGGRRFGAGEGQPWWLFPEDGGMHGPKRVGGR